MRSVRIVPALDELKHRELRLGMGAEGHAINKLALMRREEALPHRVFVAIALPVHGGSDTGLLATLSEGDRGELDALIGTFQAPHRPLRTLTAP